MSQSMTRAPSEEPPKVSKRKGTRSVSTLTPSQLARKRANDREAQRAIRARTKEHIERLERELEEMKSRRYSNNDETIMLLERKNKELENELMHCRETLQAFGLLGRINTRRLEFDMDGIHPPTPSSLASRAPSFGQGSAEYNGQPAFGSSYLPTPEPSEPWPTVVPVSAVSVPSVVSSPCSSTGHPEDYMPGYIPTSVPASMMGSSGLTQGNISCIDTKVEFVEDIDTAPTEHGYPQSAVPHSSSAYMQQQQQQQQQPWSMYPGGSAYYSQSPAI